MVIITEDDERVIVTEDKISEWYNICGLSLSFPLNLSDSCCYSLEDIEPTKYCHNAEELGLYDINCEYKIFLKKYFKLLACGSISEGELYYKSYLGILKITCNINISSSYLDSLLDLLKIDKISSHYKTFNKIILSMIKVLNTMDSKQVIEMYNDPVPYILKLLCSDIKFDLSAVNDSDLPSFIIFLVGYLPEFDDLNVNDYSMNEKYKNETLLQLSKILADFSERSASNDEQEQPLPINVSGIGLAERRIIKEIIDAPKFINKTGKKLVRDRFKEEPLFNRPTLLDYYQI